MEEHLDNELWPLTRWRSFHERDFEYRKPSILIVIYKDQPLQVWGWSSQAKTFLKIQCECFWYGHNRETSQAFKFTTQPLITLSPCSENNKCLIRIKQWKYESEECPKSSRYRIRTNSGIQTWMKPEVIWWFLMKIQYSLHPKLRM